MLSVFWRCYHRKTEAGCMLWKVQLETRENQKNRRQWLNLEKEALLVERWGGREDNWGWDEDPCILALSPQWCPPERMQRSRLVKNKPMSASADFSRNSLLAAHHGEAHILPSDLWRLLVTWPGRELVALFLSGRWFSLSRLIPEGHRSFRLKCQWEKSI